MKINKLIKYHDTKTFMPKMRIEFDVDTSEYEKNGFGNKLKALMEEFKPKRLDGIQIFKAETPCIEVEYTSITGETQKVCMANDIMVLDSFDLIYFFEKTFGKNADVFVYSVYTQSVVNPTSFVQEYLYFIKCCAVTEKMRNEKGLVNYIKKD